MKLCVLIHTEDQFKAFNMQNGIDNSLFIKIHNILE